LHRGGFGFRFEDHDGRGFRRWRFWFGARALAATRNLSRNLCCSALARFFAFQASLCSRGAVAAARDASSISSSLGDPSKLIRF